MPGTLAWRRAISRFGYAYWILFCSSVLTQIFDFSFLEKTVGRAWNEIGLLVGRIVGVDGIATDVTGSGDRTIDWLTLLAVLGLALLVTGIWTGLDREGRHDERVRGFVRIVLRYSLAFLMLSYGIAKLDASHSQFPAPAMGRLTQTFGSASPMGMLWTFMGSSQAYTKFAGIGEVLGGVLLLSRRTTLVGALVLVPVLTNVVMLNFCYDVPVKINSAHYLVMAIAIALPDARRLVDVVVLRRAAEAPPPLPVLRWRGRRAPVIAAKLAVLGAFIWPTYQGLRANAESPAMWFDGYWQVDSFTRNGTEIPAIVDDKTRWNRMKFESEGEVSYMRWHNMDRSTSTLYVVAEHADDHFTFKPAQQDGPTVTFALTRSDADHIAIAGTVGSDKLSVTLHRLRAEQMPLTSRGFHWISEFPYNR